MNQLEISFGTPLRIVVAREDEAPPAPWLTVWTDDFKFKARGTIMYTMPIDHKVTMQVAYVDSHGNPAKVDGDVEWATSDSTIINLNIDNQDSTIVVVTSAGAIGQAQVTATADADLGEGVRSLVTTVDVEIIAGEAVAGTISPVGPAEPV